MKATNQEMINEAENQLLLVLRLSSEGENASVARTQLGELYFLQGRYSEAKTFLSREIPNPDIVISPRDDDGLRKRAILSFLAKCYGRMGDNKLMTAYAKGAIKNYRARLEFEPRDALSRVALIECHALLYEFQPGEELLLEALRSKVTSATADDKELTQWKSLLAEVYVQWAKHLKGDSAANRQRQYLYLSQAIQLNPNSQLWFDGIADLLTQNDAVSVNVREFLEGLLAEGKAEGLCHLLLGNRAFLNDPDPAQAEFHLQKAFDLLPNAAIVSNNLAWFLAMRPDSQPEKALELINPVIERFGRSSVGLNARFHDTRGHIYIKLERWKEALDDLELALPTMPENSSTHESLAEAYEHLGNARMADKHRQLMKKKGTK